MAGKKPKFRLDLAINDLANIPHTSGYCYVDMVIGDGQQGGLRAALSLLKPISNTGSSGASDDVSEISKLSRLTGGDAGNHSGGFSSTKSGCIHVRTSRRKIHNFKCLFNYKVSCNLKFSVRRRDSMVGPKFMNLRVYYVPDKSKTVHHHTELGLVKLNLSEYLNFNDSITTKYLLQDSKINSILGLTLSLDELPAEYEFHTLLQIDDSKSSAHGSSHLTISKPSDLASRSFQVPQFQRKTVFGGLDSPVNNGLAGLAGLGSKVGLTGNSSDEDVSKTLDKLEHSKSHDHKTETGYFGSGTVDDVIVDPTISNLYRRVLESTWDPDLYCLLRFSPQKIVEDIFNANGENVETEMDKQIQKYELSDENTDGFKDMNGLINETKYRDNLKSWGVTWA